MSGVNLLIQLSERKWRIAFPPQKKSSCKLNRTLERWCRRKTASSRSEEKRQRVFIWSQMTVRRVEPLFVPSQLSRVELSLSHRHKTKQRNKMAARRGLEAVATIAHPTTSFKNTFFNLHLSLWHGEETHLDMLDVTCVIVWLHRVGRWTSINGDVLWI